MAEFQIKIECVWSQDGSFLDLKSDSKENIVGDGIKSAMKEGFQISEDLSKLGDDDEKMEVIESDVKNKEKLKTYSSPSVKESIIVKDEKITEEELDIKKIKTEETQEELEEESDEDDEEEEASDEDPESTTKENGDHKSGEIAEKVNEEATDSTALLNLTREKIKEVECTPPKYSPKMTRSRARASAVKKVLTPEEKTARLLRSAKKAPKPK